MKLNLFVNKREDSRASAKARKGFSTGSALGSGCWGRSHKHDAQPLAPLGDVLKENAQVPLYSPCWAPGSFSQILLTI